MKTKSNDKGNKKKETKRNSDSELSKNSRRESVLGQAKSKVKKHDGSTPGTVGKKDPNRSTGSFSKKRKSSSSTERHRPAKKRDRNSVEMVRIRQYSKWQPVEQTTFSTVMQIVDSNISHVLNLCSTKEYGDIQEHLMTLKSSFQKEMKKLRAPEPVAEYNNVNNMLASLAREIQEGRDQLDCMEEEIDRLQDLLDEGQIKQSKMTKELEVAEAKIQQQSNCGDLQTDVLNLPVYSTRQFVATSGLMNGDQAIRDCIRDTWDVKQKVNASGNVNKT